MFLAGEWSNHNFTDFRSMAFLNVQQTFRAGQPGMSSIKIT